MGVRKISRVRRGPVLEKRRRHGLGDLRATAPRAPNIERKAMDRPATKAPSCQIAPLHHHVPLPPARRS